MQHIDELIREYLLFRGFTNALKWFDFDSKLDKDKGFRVSELCHLLKVSRSFLLFVCNWFSSIKCAIQTVLIVFASGGQTSGSNIAVSLLLRPDYNKRALVTFRE